MTDEDHVLGDQNLTAAELVIAGDEIPADQTQPSTTETGHGDPNQAHKLRVAVLTTNVVFAVLIATVPAIVVMFEPVMLNPNWQLLLQVIPSILIFGPISFAIVLAAWGPARAAVRSILLLVFVAFVATGSSIANHFSGLYFELESGLAIQFANSFVSWLSLIVPAALLLAMFGSIRRLRIGPPDLPPIRTTILSIMAATAILGALISGRAVIDAAFYEASGIVTTESSSELQGQVIMQVLVGSVLIGAVAYTGAAAAFHWPARIVAGVVQIGIVVVMTVLTEISLFGISPFILRTALILSMLSATSWIAISVRILHRSGWQFSRR